MRLPRLFASVPVVAAAVAAVLLSSTGSTAAAPAARVAHPAALPAAVAIDGAVGSSLVSSTLATSTTLSPRFYRETVRYGAQDVSPYQIAHVFEVQIRLTRAGAYTGPLTGYFGSLTRAAVMRFQHSRRLPVTGVVDATTWIWLIRVSTARSWGYAHLPAACRQAGWHTCYSRPTHELFTFYSGTWWNSWLVRGGSYTLQTVPGTYRVYWQDIDHQSSLFNGAPMPYSQFFYGGEAIHGSATMVNPLSGHSHGCVNMYIEDAAQLWRLTAGRTHIVTVFGAWA